MMLPCQLSWAPVEQEQRAATERSGGDRERQVAEPTERARGDGQAMSPQIVTSLKAMLYGIGTTRRAEQPDGEQEPPPPVEAADAPARRRDRVTTLATRDEPAGP